jgi:multidrug efflux system membrane fusion protein
MKKQIPQLKIPAAATLTLALMLALALSACNEKQTQQSAPPPPTITAATVITDEVIEYSEYTGRLDSAQDVEIRARVSGYLNQIHFEEGERVKKGQLLFSIDPRPFAMEANQASASLAQTQAALNLAETNLKRITPLLEQKAISQQEFDLRKSESEQAQANYELAKATLERADLNLEFTEVRSPIDGITGQHLANQGNLVSGGSEGATLLTTVVPHDPIYVYFEIDEATMLHLTRRVMKGELPGRGATEKTPVEMKLADENEYTRQGVLDFVNNRMDRNTATLLGRARFENNDQLMTPGLFARVRIRASRPYQGVLIPDEATGTMQSKKFVWVINSENQPEQRIVELGPQFNGLRIVKSGLKPEEKIVVNGLQMIRPGAPVNVEMGEIEYDPAAALAEAKTPNPES